MSYRENKNQQNLLNQFLAEYGVQLSEDTLGKLYDFADLVVETKQFGNLISAKDSEKFLSRHIADSLIPYIYIVKKGNVILEQGKAAAIESMDSSVAALSQDDGGRSRVQNQKIHHSYPEVARNLLQ